MKALRGKERFLQSALRAIFSAVAVFWASVVVLLMALVRQE